MATILVTRPEREAQRTAEKLRAAGHEVILSPALVVHPVEAAPPEGAFDGIMLASPRAAEWLGRAEIRERLQNVPVFAVGDQTAAAAREAGYQDARSADGAADDLADLVARSLPAPARLLAPVGRVHGEEPAATLKARGYGVETVVVYDAVPAEQLASEAVAGLKYDVVDAALHFSARSAAVFVELAAAAGARDKLARVRHVCLSREVAESLPDDLRDQAIVAAAPNEASLLAALDGAPAAESPVSEHAEAGAPARAKRPSRSRTAKPGDVELAPSDALGASAEPEALASAQLATPMETPPFPRSADAATTGDAGPDVAAERAREEPSSASPPLEEPAGRPSSEEPAEPPPAARERRNPILAGAVAGALAAAAVAAFAAMVLAPPPAPDVGARLAAYAPRDQLAAAERKLDALAADAARQREDLQKTVSDLAARLERMASAPSPGASDAAQEQRQALTEVRQALAGVAQRLAALEGRSQQQIAALESRVEEAARAAARPAPPSATAEAVRKHALATALVQALGRGAPYRAELDALKGMGVAAAPALDVFADGGAPSPRLLADEFKAVAAAFSAPPRAEPGGSVLDRAAAALKQLVRVRPLGESGGEDPVAAAARIESMLARGALQDALAAFDALPASARAAGAEWRRRAQDRLAAGAAAQAALEDAARALSAPSL